MSERIGPAFTCINGWVVWWFAVSLRQGTSISFLQRPLRNKLQATEGYINCSSWYLFRNTGCKMGSNHDIITRCCWVPCLNAQHHLEETWIITMTMPNASSIRCDLNPRAFIRCWIPRLNTQHHLEETWIRTMTIPNASTISRVDAMIWTPEFSFVVGSHTSTHNITSKKHGLEPWPFPMQVASVEQTQWFEPQSFHCTCLYCSIPSIPILLLICHRNTSCPIAPLLLHNLLVRHRTCLFSACPSPL